MSRFTTHDAAQWPTSFQTRISTGEILSSRIPDVETTPHYSEEEIATWLPERLPQIDASTYFWAAVNAALFICILGGNTLTIIAIRTCRRLRAIISNLFILSLAVSDLIVGLALPYHVAFYLGWNLGNSHMLCMLRFFLMIFACCVSCGTLISIAIDRYIAIVYALHYRRYMTRRVAYLIIAVTWFIGAVIASIPMFWNNWETAKHCEFDEILPSGYVVGIITPAFIIIWTFMLILYWRIMREASRQARQLASCSDWKSIQIVVLIMGCFTICWLPYFIVVLTETFRTAQKTNLLYKYALTLATSNSGLNPVIYCWKNSNFRKAFVRILCCRSPNCNIQKIDASHFQTVVKSTTPTPPTSSTPTTTTTTNPTPPTVQSHIIILPVCEQAAQASMNCLNNAVKNITAQHQHNATSLCGRTSISPETYTCAICKSVLRNSMKIQENLNYEMKTFKINA